MMACALITEGMTVRLTQEGGWELAGASLDPWDGSTTRKETDLLTRWGADQPSESTAQCDFQCLTVICISRRSQNGLNHEEDSLLYSGWTQLGDISQGKNVLHLQRELVYNKNKGKMKTWAGVTTFQWNTFFFNFPKYKNYCFLFQKNTWPLWKIQLTLYEVHLKLGGLYNFLT